MPTGQKNNIEQLQELLPQGYESAAWETKALSRHRGLDNEKKLMHLILVHLMEGTSLWGTAALGAALDIAKLTDNGFRDKFRRCKGWINWVLERLGGSGIADYRKPKGLEDYRILAIDASKVLTQGATKESWTLHYALDIYSLRSHEYTVTEEATGESLINFTLEANDLVIADRGYGSLKGISHCLSSQADFILRLSHNRFNMYEKNGDLIDVVKKAKGLDYGEAMEFPVYLNLPQISEEFVELRLCVRKKTREAIKATMEKLDKEERSKRQRTVSREREVANEYIVLITSLPKNIGTEQVLAGYRLRWQVELYFKRLKSLLGCGSIPKREHENIEVWLNGKIMVAILLEVLLSQQDFSPLCWEQAAFERMEADGDCEHCG